MRVRALRRVGLTGSARAIHPNTRVRVVKLAEALAPEPGIDRPLEAAASLGKAIDGLLDNEDMRLTILVISLVASGHVAINHLPLKQLPLQVRRYPIYATHGAAGPGRKCEESTHGGGPKGVGKDLVKVFAGDHGTPLHA